MREEKVFIDGEFGKICGILHEAESKEEIVIILHGYSSNKETSAKINATELQKIGISAILIDFDNQGESDLDFQTGISIPNYVSQVLHTIAFVKKRGYNSISLIGTSFGGIISLAVALKHPIKRMCLRAPVYDYNARLEKQWKKEVLDEFVKQGYMPRVHKNGTYKINIEAYTTAKFYNMYEKADQFTQPILILHGDADTIVPLEDSQRMIPLLKNARLEIIKGADHGLGVNGDYSKCLELLLDFFH